MATTILGNSTTNFQWFSTFKDEIRPMQPTFKQFLDEIILENATKRDGYWTLFVNDLSLPDKKIFLSYLVDSDLYEDFTNNHFRQTEAFKEYESEMQYFIDLRIDDFYHEYMEDKKNHAYTECDVCLTTSLT